MTSGPDAPTLALTSRLAIVLTAGALLVVAWLVVPPLTPPLYDGLTTPPPAYRYLNPPSGVPHTNKRPTSGRIVMSASDVQSGGAFVNTQEPTAPQARLTFDPGALALPAGTKQVILTIRPVPPPSTLPTGGIDGNVYRYAATTSSGATIPVRHGQIIRVLLRGTGAQGTPTIEQFTAGHWRARKTVHLLNTIYYLAQPTSFGDFALVIPGKAGTASNYLPLAVVGGVVVLLMIAGLLAVRLARSRGPD